jgi:filamentous hemagglutinin family protein
MAYHRWTCKSWLLSVVIALTENLLWHPLHNPAMSQITSDNTLGTNVGSDTLIRGILSNQIDGGAIRGTNLFHSFREFNVGDGRGVYFSSPAGIQNILNRVTGANRSEINGTLGVLGTANFFLINPNGIRFGPNARLDISGSFVGSTASSVTFTDGTQFATSGSNLTLSISTPLGLQFGQASGGISSQGASLSVPSGNALVLVGKGVTIEGGALLAPGGRIELGSVTDDSLVNLSLVNNSVVLGYEKVQNFQNILLSKDSLVRANEPAGTVTLQGQQITVQDGAQVSTTTFGSGNGGNLTVRASESVIVSGVSGVTQKTGGLFSRVAEEAQGSGGDLIIEAKKLIVEKGAQVNVSSSGLGKSGNLLILASDIDLVGSVPPPSVSKSGNITTTTVIFPSPNDPRTGLFARAEGLQGTSGNITIDTKKLRVRDNALISASTLSQGNAGNIIIRSPEGSVELNFGGIFAQVLDGVQAEGGNIIIETNKLLLERGSTISVSNFGRGIGGNLKITAGDIFLGSQKPISESRFFSQVGELKAETISGNGGNISLNVQNRLLLRLGSLISTTSGTAGAGGDGGIVTINAPFIIAVPKENSDIRANAFEGTGGQVQIFARELFGINEQATDTPRSDITASSNRGVAGTVTITTPNFETVRLIEELPESIPEFRFIAQGCESARGKIGRFSIKDEDKRPQNPVEFLDIEKSGSSYTPQKGAIIEAQGFVRHPSDPNLVFLKTQPEIRKPPAHPCYVQTP